MKYNKKFLMLGILLALVAGNANAEDYFLAQGETKKAEETLKQEEEKGGFGEFSVSGNAKSFQRNGKVNNQGVSIGKVRAEGLESKKSSKKGEVLVAAQGNAVVSVAYSPFSNKRDIDKKIDSVENKGLLSGTANLKGGNAEIHGTVGSVVVGNGVGAYGLADFGEVGPAGGGSDTGIVVDGGAGASRGGRSRSRRSLSAREVSVERLTEKAKDVDQYGKNNKIAIGNIKNSSEIEGKLSASTPEGYPREKGSLFGETDLIQPQWRDITATSSGNGITSFAYITTPAKLNFSEEKENSSNIGELSNHGSIHGSGELKTGNKGTHTNIRSFASGNALSSVAYTNNNAKHKTIAKIAKIENHGELEGKLKAEVGSNTGRGWHEYSNAMIKGSGNGISVYARSSNGQVKRNEAKIEEIKNKGLISGELFTKAGSGYGENMAQIESSGNGIASFVSGGGKENKESSIGKIENSGIVVGKAIVYGGKDKEGAEKKIPPKKHILPIYEKSIPVGTSDNEAENPGRWLANKNEVLKKYNEEKKKAKKDLEKIRENLENLNASIENKKSILVHSEERKQKEETILNKVKDYYKESVNDTIKELDKKMENLNYLAGKEKEKKVLEDRLKKIKRWKEEIPKSSKVNNDVVEAYNDIYAEKISSLKEEKKKKENELKYSFWEDQKEKKKMEIAKIQEKIEKEEAKLLDFNTEEVATNREKLMEEIKTLEREIAKQKEVEAALLPLTESNHKENTIQTTTDMYASGNGISIQGEGGGNPTSSTKIGKFGGLENEGLISGYAEVYHGYSQKDYSRIAHQGSGAGLVVRGNVSEKVTNAGIISGSDFALLSEGRINDAYSIKDPSFESGFQGGVDNYGILAGRVIIGGHRVDPKTEEGYRYFETIYNAKNPHNNYGMYVVYTKDGSVKEIILGNKKGTYKGKEIVNVKEEKGSYLFTDSAIGNKIINGIGKEALVKVHTGEKLEVNNSILNSLGKTVKLEDNVEFSIKHTVVNTNFSPIGNTYAILGSKGINTVKVLDGSTINGKVDLGDGDDHFIVSGKNYFNETIDLGKGKNILSFEEAPFRETKIVSLALGEETTKSSVFLGRVENANKIEVKDNITFLPSTRISGVEEVNIESGKVLNYRFAGKDKQAFVGLEGKELKVISKGEFRLTPLGEKLQIGKIKDLLGYELSIIKPEIKPEPKPVVKREVEKKIEEKKENFFIDSRAIPTEYYSKKAFDAYIVDYKKTGKNLLEEELSNQESFKKYLYDSTHNNPIAMITDSSLSLMKEYNHVLSESKFMKKGEFGVFGNYISHEKKYNEGEKKVKFQGGIAKVSYGLSERWNASSYFGGGELKIGEEKERAQSIMAGVEFKYGKENFEWTNSFLYNKVNPKKLANVKAYSLYTEGKHRIPLSNSWDFVSTISAMMTRMESRKSEWKNLVIKKQKEQYFHSEMSASFEKRIEFKHSQLKFNLGTSYTTQDDLKDMKAYWKGGESEFYIEGGKNKNYISGNFGMSYEHHNGVSSKLSWRYSNKNRLVSLGIGYHF